MFKANIVKQKLVENHEMLKMTGKGCHLRNGTMNQQTYNVQMFPNKLQRQLKNKTQFQKNFP